MDILQQISDRIEALRAERQHAKMRLEGIEAELHKLLAAQEVVESLANPPESSPKSKWDFFVRPDLKVFNSKRNQIWSVARSFLKEGSPKTTEQILEEVEKWGIDVSGEDEKTKLRNLSAYLSHGKKVLGIESTKAGWVMNSDGAESNEITSEEFTRLAAEAYSIKIPKRAEKNRPSDGPEADIFK